MVKGLCIFIIVMAVLVALLGTTFSLSGFLSNFTSELELLKFSDINIPSFPSYSPSQDSGAVERIAYFFTDYLPDLFTFFDNFISESIKLVFYALINFWRITEWVFNLF